MRSKTIWCAALLRCLTLITFGLLAPAVHAAAAGDLLWARSAGGIDPDYGTGIAVDAAGNALVTGYFYFSATFGAGEANETTLTAVGYSDMFIAQYAPDGTLHWARSAGGIYGDSGFGIAVDAAGNALVTGFFNDSATFGAGETNETTLNAAGDVDLFIAQYASDGSLRWARSAGGSSWDHGSDIAVDAAGNALVTGSVDFDPLNTGDILIAKYAPDGTLRWARSAGGSGVDTGDGIAVDTAGNAMVTGSFQGNATFGAGETNETTLTALGRADIFIAQYAPDGSLRWARSAGGIDYDPGYDITVDAAGNALVTGYFQGSATFGAGEVNETTLTAEDDDIADIFIAQYASDGTLRWARSAGGSGIDTGNGIAVDAAGNALVTGEFQGSATFGADEANETTLTSTGDDDIFIAQYASDGTLRWARSAGGPNWDSGHGIAVDAAGNALVTGHFISFATFGAGEANETTVTGTSADIFIAKHAGTPLSEQPDLAIAKHASPLLARVDENLIYTLTVMNQGAVDATEVLILDWLPEKVTVVSLPMPCQLVDEETVECWLGSLAGGSDTQLDLVVQPKKPGLLVNEARVEAAEADLNEDNNEVTLRTHVMGYGRDR